VTEISSKHQRAALGCEQPAVPDQMCTSHPHTLLTRAMLM